MRNPTILLAISLAIGGLVGTRAEGEVKKTSVCAIEENPESFLHAKVEFGAVLRVGSEYPSINDGRCLFRFAFGDDYQTFGDRFATKKNGQWRLMRSLIVNSNNKNDCPFFVRIVRARFRGVVERVPAGTSPESDMPLEIIILSVSQVEAVPIECSNSSKSN